MDALLRRRQMMLAGGTPPSPSGPIPVDYIETDGVAYINTGIKGNAPMSSKIQVVPVAHASGNNYVCGARKDSGNTRLVFLVIASGKTAGPGYANGLYSTDVDVSASIDNGTLMMVQTALKAGDQDFYVKQAGESSYTSKSHAATGTITTGRDIFVLALNNQGNASVSASGTKVKTVQLFSDFSFSNLVFDAYACYYNGEYGMWDNISNSFFGNAAGSGEFTGPSINQ